MSCYLNIRSDAGTLRAPLAFSGRLLVRLGGGASELVENTPAVPADQGGRLPIYDNVGTLIGSAPFVCDADATRSSGGWGLATGAGGLEGWVSSGGSIAGRLN